MIPSPLNRINVSMSGPKQLKKAYEDGKKAYYSKLPPQCPKELDKRSEERKAWFDGYYESYCIDRHQATFKKYGIKFP